ncbi:hypothetical protein [Nocardia sp. CA-135398]|uniref:hypothetical protein n=1 Tax=Nocardia sp. CA-135398 TaxID=3239977 RepID=UPI003D96117A
MSVTLRGAVVEGAQRVGRQFGGEFEVLEGMQLLAQLGGVRGEVVVDTGMGGRQRCRVGAQRFGEGVLMLGEDGDRE